MAKCARQLVLEPYLVLFSLRPDFENLLQLFFGAYKSAAIVFRVVFIIVRLFNTFDIIHFCVLWIDMIQLKRYIIIIIIIK